MSDLVLIAILVAGVLGYVSVLLFITLTSQGIISGRVYKLLIEIWITFALIVAIFLFVTRWLGTVPAGSLAEEFAARLTHWRELSWLQQGLIFVGAAIAALLFVHVFWSLRAVQKYARRRSAPPADGGKIE